MDKHEKANRINGMTTCLNIMLLDYDDSIENYIDFEGISRVLNPDENKYDKCRKACM